MSTKLMGECEACPKTDVELFVVGNLELCADCRKKEIEAIEASRKDIPIEKLIEHSRKQDASMNLKQEIFNATTVSFVALRSAIDHDESIKDKNAAVVNECTLRIKKFDELIFAQKEALTKLQNERYAWNSQTVDFVAKLREDERAKYKQFDVNYKPPTTGSKKTHTTKPVGPAKKGFTGKDKSDLATASQKYDVPASAVRAYYVGMQGKLTYEQCAHELAKMSGKIK